MKITFSLFLSISAFAYFCIQLLYSSVPFENLSTLIQSLPNLFSAISKAFFLSASFLRASFFFFLSASSFLFFASSALNN